VPEAWRRPEEEEVVAVGTISSDVRRWWVPRRCGGGNRYGHERERECDVGVRGQTWARACRPKSPNFPRANEIYLNRRKFLFFL
jgi:hypothetical protein